MLSLTPHVSGSAAGDHLTACALQAYGREGQLAVQYSTAPAWG